MAGRRAALTGAVAMLSCVLAVLIGPVQAMAVVPQLDAGERTNFVVLGPEPGDLDQTEASIRSAGGRILQVWDEISVVVVTSTRADFADGLRGRPGVDAVGATRNLVQVTDQRTHTADPVADLRSGTAGGDDWAEADFDKQWNMRMIRADDVHQVTDGDRSVLVGVLDTGIDPTNPDLAGNVDPDFSVGCTRDGVPDTRRSAWQVTSSHHGTHVAGIIAGARNGTGIVGVAPNVRLAAVKVVDDSGYIYPEYALCGILWAAEQGMDVTNHSYLLDPWNRWCSNSADQSAVETALRRAMAWSEEQQVVTVASAGNGGDDLTQASVDRASPSNGAPTERRVDAGCRPLPAGLPDVVTVSSVGASGEKAYYSSYGDGAITVTAPGGDAWHDWQAERPDTSTTIWSTTGTGHSWMQGTSMAAPHVAGVVALIRSVHPELTADEVRQRLVDSARPLGCPDRYDYNGDGRVDAVCEGDQGQGFYGAGLVDALAAVRSSS